VFHFNQYPQGMEQPKEGPVHYHSSVHIIYKISFKYKIDSGREVPRCESPVPKCAKTGANEFWPQPSLAQITQNAAKLEDKVPLRSEGSIGSEAWMRSGLHSRAWKHACAGPRLHPTGGTTEQLRRIRKNCALREAASVKFAG
jgi:hypothetical protein